MTATITESYTVRWKEPDGRKRRRSFDTVDDALDFQAKRRSAKRWRPEELRQEQAGRLTLGEFFEQWWRDHAMVELKRVDARDLPLPVGGARRAAARARSRCATSTRGASSRSAASCSPPASGRTSVVKTMSMLQRVFRDAVEYGEVAFNPFKAVQKPSPGPTREAHPFTPLQVERLALDLDMRGYEMSAVLVRLMAYTGLRPQEALALHWYAVREQTLLVELANADGELERLKNRKRSRKRSRTVDLMTPVQRGPRGVATRRRGDPTDDELVFPHETLRRAVARRALPHVAPADLRPVGRERRAAEQAPVRPAPHVGVAADRRGAAVDRRDRRAARRQDLDGARHLHARDQRVARPTKPSTSRLRSDARARRWCDSSATP